jgi:phosphoserine aminotransferase
MKNQVLNFGAGPAALPQQVVAAAAAAVLDYEATGLSILEIFHRSPPFEAILAESKQLVKTLCRLNDDYEVLWIQGGGRLQFAMIPLNFLGNQDTAGYIDSGHWAAEAMETARYYGKVSMLSSAQTDHYTHLPPWPEAIPNHLAYLHLTTNNTIYGTQMPDIPSIPVPLVADMSSDIFGVRRDYSRFSLFYAVAQKNIGAAGVTLVVVRKSWLAACKRTLPAMLHYQAYADKNSMPNTPPVFAIYTCLLTLRWIQEQGIDNLEKANRAKAAALYAELERNSMFCPLAAPAHRSLMNVVFRGKDKASEQEFKHWCAQKGIVGIEGHRSVGAFRVSLYNAMPMSGVETLIAEMQAFEQAKG